MIIKNLIDFKIINFNLPVIYINTTSTQNIKQAIQNKIKQIPLFLKNKPVIIDVAKLTHKNNWTKLYKLILEEQLYVIGVCSCNDIKLKKIITDSGLPVLTKNKNYYYTPNNITQNKNDTIIKTKLINTPVRSGQRIYAQNCDLIIINDVNTGAEIISDGNIHIYGSMKGRILAGASGNKTCQIFCTNFSPELVSINGQYWINDQIPKQYIGKSVRINLENNTLMIHYL